MRSPKIVFFGSGPVAAASLSSLLNNFEVEAVITKPSTIHEISAAAPGVNIHTVNNRQELEELVGSNTFESEVGILVDFGIIVSKKIIQSFPKGIINSHFSLLPQWRGADPIAFSVLSGQPKTGVSLMIIDEGLDTGKIIVQKSIKIAVNATTPTLTDTLVELSNELLARYLPKYVEGVAKPRSQPHPDRATYSRKLKKEDGLIDWTKPADQIEREIRAYKDWPKSRTSLGGKDVIITEAIVVNSNGKPGTAKVSGKELVVFCGKNALSIKRLKPASKNEMTAQAFLAGYKI